MKKRRGISSGELCSGVCGDFGTSLQVCFRSAAQRAARVEVDIIENVWHCAIDYRGHGPVVRRF